MEIVLRVILFIFLIDRGNAQNTDETECNWNNDWVDYELDELANEDGYTKEECIALAHENGCDRAAIIDDYCICQRSVIHDDIFYSCFLPDYCDNSDCSSSPFPTDSPTAPSPTIEASCNWIESNRNADDDEYPISGEKGAKLSREECIIAAHSNGCDIANMDEDQCWCQFGDDRRTDGSDIWSCFLNDYCTEYPYKCISGDTLAPTASPSSSPTFVPTHPSLNPTLDPTFSPTFSPSTVAELLAIEFEESDKNDLIFYISLFSFLCVLGIITGCFQIIHCIKPYVLPIQAVDDVHYLGVILYFFQMMDMYSDVIFSIQLYFYCDYAQQDDNIDFATEKIFQILFLTSMATVVIPYVLNYVSSIRIVADIVNDPVVNEYTKGYFQRFGKLYGIGVLISGGSFYTLQLLNSNWIGFACFRCGLSQKRIEKYSSHKILLTTFLENIPQFIIQSIVIWKLDIITYTVVIASLSSVFNVLLSIMSHECYYYASDSPESNTDSIYNQSIMERTGNNN